MTECDATDDTATGPGTDGTLDGALGGGGGGDAAGVVLQFSQRKLCPPPRPFLIHLKYYFCINKPRKRKQRKFYLW